MLVLTATWGIQLSLVKIALLELSAIMQSLIRAVLSTALLSIYMIARGESLLGSPAERPAGVIVGVLFALEFLLLFVGLGHTTAARGVVFFYTMPFFVAAGAWLFLKAERLRPLQWLGLAVAFGGVAFAFADGLRAGSGAPTLFGDTLMIGAAIAWAATTIMLKSSPLASAPATRVLWYQLALSIPVSALAAAAAGERMPAWPVSATTLAIVVFQSVWVAFVTYLVWFALIQRHSASVLSTFSFLTPLFGVAAGHFILGETIGWTLGMALGLVIAGLVLVNRRPRRG